MVKANFLLEEVRVASPCQVPWEAMSGDAQVRFCPQCTKHVYNLSEMSRADAEALLQRTEERVCVRFYQRADGTVMTSDCPVGVRAALKPSAALTAALVGFGMLLVALCAGLFMTGDSRGGLRDIEPFKTILGWFGAGQEDNCLMGALELPRPLPPPGGGGNPPPQE
ncbi:MAG TPA: hypothetical protein VEL76_00405 [Gemmataceae bacterium]|nr:hypothetical protein [Gemmataceae bacterium]